MKNTLSILLFLLVITASAQQISVPRIDEMPDFPDPYFMRDWKQLAQKYDSTVFNLYSSGTYLPLPTIIENTINYPEHNTFGLQTYVGTNSLPGREAINLIPAVVGATLVGIDKSDQFDHNWVLYCEEFFNRKPQENVYLNGPNTSSGHDWWYETMPNIFFYQLNSQYPHTGDFDYQVVTVADRWLQAVVAMGGGCAPWSVPYMNYRAFKLSTMTPLEAGVKQAEAAGAIGWVLYQAFTITEDEKYRIGAEWCLEFLSTWPDNPSYEIQMPYGAYIAARMNAELGADYDIEKMVNWCFDRNLQRGWGAIVGSWGGMDLSGLIGEVNAAGNDYVFNMNSLEQIGALVPMVRYDDRFAAAIAKWALNVANATRFYYSAFLPDDMQDNESWAHTYDTLSVISYESMREKENGPYGTGDAMNGGWAETNLCLYGSSHVGILGGIINKTNVDGILLLDLLATDYYHPPSFPSYLIYNPYDSGKTIGLELPPGNYDIYDALSNQVILHNVSDNVELQIQALSTLSLVYIPAGTEISYRFNHAYADDICIDYNAGVLIENYPPRIKCLAAIDSIALTGSPVQVFCTADDQETGILNYLWLVDDDPIAGDEILFWEAPDTIGTVTIGCIVSDGGGLSDTAYLDLPIVEKIKYPPEILNISATSSILSPAGSTEVLCDAIDANGDSLSYFWHASQGELNGSGSSINYIAPDDESNIYIVCQVMDTDSMSSTDSVLILVRDPGSGQTGDMVAWYPFNGSSIDISGNGHDGTEYLCNYVNDQHGNDNMAVDLYSSNSRVLVSNHDELNFTEGLTLCMWLKVDQHYDRESYPISHGNWTSRWKISIGSERLRFTVNGNQGIVDLDSKSLLEEDTWYHVAAVYNGQECLLFLNGSLEAFAPFSGTINSSPYDLVFGQSLPDQGGFDFDGSLDNARIYNYGLSYPEIKEIYEDELSSIEEQMSHHTISIHPNPTSGKINIAFGERLEMFEIRVVDAYGRTVFQKDYFDQEQINLQLGSLDPGIYILSVISEGKRITSEKIIKQ